MGAKTRAAGAAPPHPPALLCRTRGKGVKAQELSSDVIGASWQDATRRCRGGAPLGTCRGRPRASAAESGPTNRRAARASCNPRSPTRYHRSVRPRSCRCNNPAPTHIRCHSCRRARTRSPISSRHDGSYFRCSASTRPPSRWCRCRSTGADHPRGWRIPTPPRSADGTTRLSLHSIAE